MWRTLIRNEIMFKMMQIRTERQHCITQFTSLGTRYTHCSGSYIAVGNNRFLLFVLQAK